MYKHNEFCTFDMFMHASTMRINLHACFYIWKLHFNSAEFGSNEKNKVFPKILIRNSYYHYVTVEEEPFPMQGLADRIATIFSKGHVNYIEDQNIISILNGKIIVNEDGVRGTGPSADRVKKIYEQFKIDLDKE